MGEGSPFSFGEGPGMRVKKGETMSAQTDTTAVNTMQATGAFPIEGQSLPADGAPAADFAPPNRVAPDAPS